MIKIGEYRVFLCGSIDGQEKLEMSNHDIQRPLQVKS